MSNLARFAVGQQSPIAPMPEGPYFEWSESGAIMYLFLDSPTEKEIEGVRKGKLQIGIAPMPPVLFIMAKINGCGGWMDMPFTIRKYQNEIFTLPEIEDNQGILLQITLIDCRTNVVKAIRAVSLSTDLSRAMRDEFIKQIKAPYSDSNYLNTVTTIQGQYSSNALAKRAQHIFIARRDD